MQIRLAANEDAEKIANVLLRSFDEYRSSYTSPAFDATTPCATTVLARLQEGPIWVAEREGDVLGTVSAVRREDSTREASCRRVFLSTTPFLDRAIRLYEHRGVRRIDDGPHDLLGTPLFTMEKWLVQHH